MQKLFEISLLLIFRISSNVVEADENRTYPWNLSCLQRRKNSLHHLPSENLVKHPKNGSYYALQLFIKDFPDIDINFQEIYQAKECPCAPGRFCFNTEYCRRAPIEDAWLAIWPYDVDAYCFDDRSRWENFAIHIWPMVWIWVALMFAAFGYSEVGSNARNFIFFKGIVNVLARCIPGNSSWARSIKRSMTRNSRMEGMIENRLQLEREERLQRRRREREVLRAALINTLLPEGRTLQVSDVLSDKVQVNLIVKTKRFLSLNLPNDLESGENNNHVDDSSLDTDSMCSICLESIDNGERVGDIVCNHLFHLDCLKQWIQRNNCCPMCKHERIAHIKIKRSRNNLVTSDGGTLRQTASATLEE